MTIVAPKAPTVLRPIADFVVQVVIGAFGFAVVMCVAVALGMLVRGIESIGFHPDWLTRTREWFEMLLFGLDLSLFALFMLVEALKLGRGLLKEIRS